MNNYLRQVSNSERVQGIIQDNAGAQVEADFHVGGVSGTGNMVVDLTRLEFLIPGFEFVNEILDASVVVVRRTLVVFEGGARGDVLLLDFLLEQVTLVEE